MAQVGQHLSTRNHSSRHDLWSIISRHIILLAVFTIIFGLLGFGAAKFLVKPQYDAQVQILVSSNSKNKAIQPNAAQQANIQSINTYKDLITSRRVLRQTAADVNKKSTSNSEKVTVAKLRGDVSVNSKQNSQVFSVNVKTDNPQLSAAVANSLGKTIRHQARHLLHANNLTVVSSAVAPGQPSYPNIRLFVIAGALLGLIIGFIVVTVRELQ